MKVFDEILEIIKKTGISLAKVAKDSGIRYDRMYQWNIGKGNPKAEDEAKLQDWLRKYKNVDNSISVEKKSVEVEGEFDLVKELVLSTKLLAHANDTYASANLILAQNMTKLTNIVEEFSLHALRGTKVASSTTKAEILEVLSKLRVADGIADSYEQSLEDIRKLLFESESLTQQANK